MLGGAEPVGDVDDRIPHQLARAVVRDVAATPDADQLGPDLDRVAAQVGREVGARAVREDVRMLEQQQVLLEPAIEQGLLDRQRLPIGDRAEPADAQHQTSSDQSFVSRISLIRRRNPAA